MGWSDPSRDREGVFSSCRQRRLNVRFLTVAARSTLQSMCDRALGGSWRWPLGRRIDTGFAVGAASATSEVWNTPAIIYHTAMGCLSFQNIAKQFGTQIVLSNVSFELNAAETVGLIGANGAGKTTIFRLLMDDFPPDTGTIVRERNLDIGLLTQLPELVEERTLHDEAGSTFADLLALEAKLHKISEQMAAGPDEPEMTDLMERYDRVNGRFIADGGHTFQTRLNEVLGGLGFALSDYGRIVANFSGGEKSRVALAKLLLRDQRYLLLDEPTNHLDIDAVRWLEKFLGSHRGGAVIISHDRYLLDRLCDRILEVEHGAVKSYPGNYTNYAETKERLVLTEQRQYAKDAAFIKKERAFIAKHIAGQRSAQAKGRRKRLERKLGDGAYVTDTTNKLTTARIRFEESTAGNELVYRCDELAMAFGDNTLFTDLAFQLNAGQRLCITGPNGTGKSTLLNIIVGTIEPTAGRSLLDHKLRVGYYRQESTQLDSDRSVLDEIRADHPELSKERARNLLAQYRFTGDDVFKPLRALSGGEQSRVRLAKLMLEAPDLLILDEPTNHLDIASREVLEEALLSFTGTILAVSHDRYFLDRIADRLLIIRDGVGRVYDGNYTYYLEEEEQRRERERAKKASPQRGTKRKQRIDKPTRKPSSPYDAMSIQELEELVMERETKLATMHERFGDAAVYQDTDELAELREQEDKLSRELAEVDAAWQQRVEALDGQ